MNFWRLIDTILPSRQEFEKAIKSGRQLRFYAGFDPTAPDLHLGHAVILFFLREMQRLGHEVIFLVGDFTARIGDPTGRDISRPPLSPMEVKKNARLYRQLAGTIIDFKSKKNPAKLMFNSRWLEKMRLADFIKLVSHFSVQQLLERDMFAKRLTEGRPIGIHEFLYPILQGYDSVALKADVEVGGRDQLFNMMIGRHLRQFAGGQKFVVALKLLVDPKTGVKMSKTEGHYVPLSAKPGDLYGKIMALPDELIWPVFELLTDLDDAEIASLKREIESGVKSKRSVKGYLARAIVGRLYGQPSADEAEADFEQVFVAKREPQSMRSITVGRGERLDPIILLMKGDLVRSKSQGRRLIEGGGVRLGGKVLKDWRQPLSFSEETVLKVGKRRFLKIKIK